MEKSELTAIFEKYCQKLRIVPDWDVKLEFVEDPTWRKTGDFKIDCEDKKAVFLLNAANPKQENLEEVICHELMHLKMYPLDQVTESLIINAFEEGSPASNFAYRQFFTTLEQTVEELTKCFLLEFGDSRELSFGCCKGKNPLMNCTMVCKVSNDRRDSMTKLGIIGAMQEEIETLLHLMKNKTEKEIAGSVFHDGVLEGLPVTVVQCGIGKVNAALCTQILCDLFEVTHLVNTGIAGSLCNDLDIGDMVVSRDAMYHDMDATAFGYPMGKVPQMDVTSFPADDALMAYAFAAAEGVNPGHTKIGRVASGDQFVASREVKERIVSVTSALCTEMEGAAIAQTAYRNRIPFVILRAISDKADNSAEMDYPTFESIAAHRCAAVTQCLAKHLAEQEAG